MANGMKKVRWFKGLMIAIDRNDENEFAIFTKDEWACGEGFRYPEFTCQSEKEAEELIIGFKKDNKFWNN